MAIDIQHDSEYLLPTHFLTTDDIISEVINLKQPEPKTREIPIRFGSYGSSSSLSSSSSSALNSPVESELNSTDTESTTEEEEEDYIAEMTRQMAHYMLQDDDDEKHKIPTPASEDTEVLFFLLLCSVFQTK